MQHTTMSVAHILTIAIICCLLAMASAAPAIAGSQQQQELQPPPLCEPGVIEEMPKHIRNVCLALENNDKLSFVLNSYLRNEASALLYRAEDLASVPSGTGKRTDVDHVFLRFGR